MSLLDRTCTRNSAPPAISRVSKAIPCNFYYKRGGGQGIILHATSSAGSMVIRLCPPNLS